MELQHHRRSMQQQLHNLNECIARCCLYQGAQVGSAALVLCASVLASTGVRLRARAAQLRADGSAPR